MQQTSGRGRLGRAWSSPPGNLYLSLVLRPEIPASRAAELGFAACVAVADCVAGLVAVPVTLKWPNDVLADGSKIAGILLEAQSSAETGLDFLVIGLGINIASHPAEARHPATSLAACGAIGLDVDSVLGRLCDRLAAALALWEGAGFGAIRTRWLDRAAGLGTGIEVAVGGETVAGIRAGRSTTDGALVLETPTGRRRVTVGDVRFTPV